MDPELGMGIEFTGRTADQRPRLEELIQRVTMSPESAAEVLVEPEGLDWKNPTESSSQQAEATADEPKDRLTGLFKNAASVSSREQFLQQLEPLRLAVSKAGSSLSSGQRSEPRIAVSRPAQLLVHETVQDVKSHPTSMIELSHHGARIDHSSLSLHPGDPVHLISGGHDVRFRVIWVGEPGTAQEGQIGLQKSDD